MPAAAGEIIGIFASIVFGSNRATSTEDDGPITTSTFLATRSAKDVSSTVPEASPESRWTRSTPVE